MKTKVLYLVAAVAIVLSVTAVKPAIAYFTDSVSAEGSIPITLGEVIPKIDEKVQNMTKTIAVENTGDYSIFVRVKAFKPEACEITPTFGAGWSFNQSDGYYYFDNPVAPGEKTPTELLLKITNPNPGSYNVIIIEEATRVHYDDNGNPKAPDWNATFKNQNEYTVGEE